MSKGRPNRGRCEYRTELLGSLKSISWKRVIGSGVAIRHLSEEYEDTARQSLHMESPSPNFPRINTFVNPASLGFSMSERMQWESIVQEGLQCIGKALRRF